MLKLVASQQRLLILMLLQAVKITYPVDIVEEEESLVQRRKEFVREIDEIITCLCVQHKRNIFKINFEV